MEVILTPQEILDIKNIVTSQIKLWDDIMSNRKYIIPLKEK